MLACDAPLTASTGYSVSLKKLHFYYQADAIVSTLKESGESERLICGCSAISSDTSMCRTQQKSPSVKSVTYLQNTNSPSYPASLFTGALSQRSSQKVPLGGSHESICSIYYLAARGILPRSIYLCAATVCSD